MASSEATTVEDYLEDQGPERKDLLEAVRATVVDNLPPGYTEQMRWGMITYEVPLELYPDTYNGQPLMYAALASQKRHVSLYLTGVYADDQVAADFADRWRATGKKLDMGKSCVRFNRLDAVPLDVVAESIRSHPVDDFIAAYEAARAAH